MMILALPAVAAPVGHLPRAEGEPALAWQGRNLAHARRVLQTNLRGDPWYRKQSLWLQREMAETWAGAVALVREYVGSDAASWLLSCSASEGGWGGWVVNHEGSGAKGWMQFMEGTYDAYAWVAKSWAAAMGLFPRMTYYTPAGQAVTGAYMYRHGETGHWSGSGC